MKSDLPELSMYQKLSLYAVMAFICIGGATLSWWAVGPLTGYERPLFVCATAAYGFGCMVGGIWLSIVLPNRQRGDES